MRVVNVLELGLAEGPGRDGFWFRAAPVGERLGAARIGAAVYEARAEVPIWPYHYHYPDEEWLYVLGGAPVLRTAHGRCPLSPGDVVCFAPGHRGAHTVEGPGRFMIFSGERSSGPFVSVYPDSDKVSVSPGIESGHLNSLLLGREGALDYWHGEGDGSVPQASVTREPETAQRPVVVNVTAEPRPDAGSGQTLTLGAQVGGQRMDAAVHRIEPGASLGAYRYEYGRELWLLVVDGEPTVQHADGERQLVPGDLACFPDGPAGGRAVHNRTGESARVLLLWTCGFPHISCETDTGQWTLRPAPDADEIRLRQSDPA